MMKRTSFIKLPIDYTTLTSEQRKLVRFEYVKLQSNKCYHCHEDLDKNPSKDILKKKINTKLFPPNFFNYPIHLHHSHETGMTIGVVHARCKAVLWQYHGE